MGSTSSASRPEDMTKKYSICWIKESEIYSLLVKKECTKKTGHTIYIINNIKAFGREAGFHKIIVLSVSFQMQDLAKKKIINKKPLILVAC